MPSSAGSTSALSHHLAQRTAPLVAQALERICADVEFYRSLPRETLDGDVTDIIRVNLDLLVRTLSNGQLPPPPDFQPISESASARADEEVPLTEVLAAYHTGARTWWDHVVTQHHRGVLPGVDLGSVGSLFFGYVHAATNAVVTGFEADYPSRSLRAGHAELLSAMIRMGDIDRVAEHFGLVVAQRYWIVCLHVGPSADEQNPDVASSVASRRKVRRLERHLSAFGFGDALLALTDSGGVALVPVRESGSQAELASYLGGLPARLGARCHVAIDSAAPHDVAARLPEVQRLLQLARRVDRSDVVYELADLAIEYQLSMPTRARELITAPLQPIATDQVLSTTLRMYLRCNANSGETAQRLHVHPNTVLYRLRKISDATGLNLTQPADLLRVLAATVADEALAPDQ